MSELLI